jgi:hypothetical protein
MVDVKPFIPLPSNPFVSFLFPAYRSFIRQVSNVSPREPLFTSLSHPYIFHIVIKFILFLEKLPCHAFTPCAKFPPAG